MVSREPASLIIRARFTWIVLSTGNVRYRYPTLTRDSLRITHNTSRVTARPRHLAALCSITSGISIRLARRTWWAPR